MKSRTKKIENGSCGIIKKKKRSQGQILKKTHARSRGHIFNPILMKLGQNVYLDEISDESENWSVMSDKKLGH